MKYKISQYARMHNVTIRTVWNWIWRGEVKIERTPTNRILIVEDSVVRTEKNIAVYARVSSSENKSNLESQKKRLLDYSAAKGYKVVKTVTEIGSGLNDRRQKLEALLVDKSIDIIVVEHSDRLARFGLNYINKLLELNGRKIEIINDSSHARFCIYNNIIYCKTLWSEKNQKKDRKTYKRTGKCRCDLLNNT